MSYREILYSVEDRVATVTLNRPDKLNAWTAIMSDEVREAMFAAEADPDVRVIVFTGAGRGFCAGADMSMLGGIASAGVSEQTQDDLHAVDAPRRDDIRPDFNRKYTYFPSIKKPVIGAINGPAAGLGFILALYCDVRIAADTAKFSSAFAKRGLIAEYGIAWLLPRLVGTGHALDILLSARTVDASEALRIGLVNRVCTTQTFVHEVNGYARELAHNVSPRSMAVIKHQVYDAHFQTLLEATARAEKEMIASLQSEDFKEGVAHFVEKRQAKFQGR
jgi:enoyl-CoA hydratase/carnithine racemase